jgi:[ribosomal protein S18]-alanine N-acetyltransferase
MQGIIIRAAEPSDLEHLLALVENSPGAPRWSPATWHQILNSSKSGVERIVLIAESVNESVGFGVLGLAADDAEIESLAVTTAWRRQGIARRICEDLLGWARARGSTQASLEVRVSNAGARALYESLGFRVAAIRRRYYRDPEEDALVMTMEL